MDASPQTCTSLSASTTTLLASVEFGTAGTIQFQQNGTNIGEPVSITKEVASLDLATLEQSVGAPGGNAGPAGSERNGQDLTLPTHFKPKIGRRGRSSAARLVAKAARKAVMVAPRLAMVADNAIANSHPKIPPGIDCRAGLFRLFGNSSQSLISRLGRSPEGEAQADLPRGRVTVQIDGIRCLSVREPRPALLYTSSRGPGDEVRVGVRCTVVGRLLLRGRQWQGWRGRRRRGWCGRGEDEPWVRWRGRSRWRDGGRWDGAGRLERIRRNVRAGRRIGDGRLDPDRMHGWRLHSGVPGRVFVDRQHGRHHGRAGR